LVLLIALFVVNSLLFLVVCSGVLFTGYRRIRVKGYRPPIVVGLMVAAGTVGIGLAAVGNHAASRTSLILFWFEFFWLPLLFSAIGMGI
jgi:hypothetical protein